MVIWGLRDAVKQINERNGHWNTVSASLVMEGCF